MFIYPKIINQNIIYTDTVLPLKDIGSNLKVTCIEKVDKYSLEECLNKIINSNPNVKFNTIQYCKQDNLIYFYTNKTISTKAWKDSKFSIYKPLNNVDEILKELETILSAKEIKKEGCISLYNLSTKICKINKNIDSIIQRCKENCEDLLEDKDYDPSLIIYNIDYKKCQIKIGIKLFYRFDDEYEDIILKKHNDDLYVVKSECFYSEEILQIIGEELSKMYDSLKKYKYNDMNDIISVEAVNSSFKIDISNKHICIYTPNQDFSLSIRNSFENYEKNKYFHNYNSARIANYIKNKEKYIFKNILIPIDECPKWCKNLIVTNNCKPSIFNSLLNFF